MDVKVDVRNTDGRMLSDAAAKPAHSSTTVFDDADQPAADAGRAASHHRRQHRPLVARWRPSPADAQRSRARRRPRRRCPSRRRRSAAPAKHADGHRGRQRAGAGDRRLLPCPAARLPLRAGRRTGGAAAAMPAPLAGGALVLGTIALSLATFMNVLDTSIANVSIPAIAGDMGVSPSQGTWVITSFAVANAISVPLTGWLTQRFGPVRLFVSSIILFVIASWLCGLAPNIGMLIAFRVLQGLVAGPMIPLSQTLLLVELSTRQGRHGDGDVGDDGAGRAGRRAAARRLHHRQHLLAVDLLHQHPGRPHRRGNHLVDLPQRATPAANKTKLDYVGLALLVIWVGALQIMVDKGKELDWFNSGSDRRVWRSWRWSASPSSSPGSSPRRTRSSTCACSLKRNFLMGTLSLSIAYGLFFGNVVLLPLWLQQYMGYTATWPGWRRRRWACWPSSCRRGSARTCRRSIRAGW